MQPGATPGTKQAPPTSLSHGMHGTERKVWYLAHGMAGHGWRGSSASTSTSTSKQLPCRRRLSGDLQEGVSQTSLRSRDRGTWPCWIGWPGMGTG